MMGGNGASKKPSESCVNPDTSGTNEVKTNEIYLRGRDGFRKNCA